MSPTFDASGLCAADADFIVFDHPNQYGLARLAFYSARYGQLTTGP
jgi:hypothetical protein